MGVYLPASKFPPNRPPISFSFGPILMTRPRQRLAAVRPKEGHCALILRGIIAEKGQAYNLSFVLGRDAGAGYTGWVGAGKGLRPAAAAKAYGQLRVYLCTRRKHGEQASPATRFYLSSHCVQSSAHDVMEGGPTGAV